MKSFSFVNALNITEGEEKRQRKTKRKEGK